MSPNRPGYRGDGDDPRKGGGLFLSGSRPAFTEPEEIVSTLDTGS